MRGFVEYVRSRRQRLAEGIRGVGGGSQPSETNFVLASFPDARWIQRGMAAQGVLVRHFAHLPEYVRITVARDDGEFRLVKRALACLRTPEALLFDMDGVLADVAQRFEEVYQGTEEAPGLRRHETLIPTDELLEGLARSFRLGVVTGRPRSDAERFLREQGVRGCFSAVVCREDGPLKPDPAPVRIALERLEARTAWMLGDTPDDSRAAVGAGVVPVGVVPPWGGETVWAALEAAGAARIVEADADFGGLFNE